MSDDELTRLRTSVRMLGRIVATDARVMQAAKIEMAQHGPGQAMQWILNAVSDLADQDAGRPWDGKESAQEWFDALEPLARDEPVPEPPKGRLARVEVKGFRDLGIVRVTETTLAGEPMLHAECDDGSSADFPPSSLHFITWLPDGALPESRAAIAAGDPWAGAETGDKESFDDLDEDDKEPF